jgi:hypothetical protein
MSFRFRQLVITLATLMGWPAVALAQTPQCDAWRGELARLDRAGSGGGSPRAAAAAQQVAAQLGRAQAAYSSMQCDGAWIFQAPPPQCNSLRGQIGQLRAQYGSLQQQSGGGNENRKRALMAAIDDNCRGGALRTQPIAPQQQQPRTLFEALFGVPDRPPPPGMPELDGPSIDPNAVPEKREPTWGAGRPVCVRTCDGFFFPLSNSPGGRDNQEDMCQALCPAAETEVFYMAGDGDIQNASRRGGGSYAGLANAGRYLRQFDASCSCKKQGQSWAQALAEAEDMLDRRRGDVMVTEQRAAEMSRARPTTESRREATRREAERQTRAGAADQAPVAPAAVVEADAAAARALEASGRSAPTAGTESAGIGPNGISNGTVSAAQGERRTVTNSAGEQRTVRIVAPAFTPAIQ